MKTTLAMVGLVVALGVLPVNTALAKADSHEGIDITVNINTANAEELDKLLVGIGPDKAASIVKYRDANGEFDSAEALMKVKGIGPSTIEKNSDRIKL
ncbi:ComEA family DNA-binding protein [Photobacterium nomapromontoriensis]|uniref:ComEA family DNA-binding protein n=1 Tax=Photobacterium nomapromontoriensis TaxID=2910237 RepID=UPI003D0ABF8A